MMCVIGVVLFALAILISVALHECGHMWVARATGMKVRRYFVGFGPTLWSTRRPNKLGYTEYGVKAVPLGGFCDIAGMTSIEEIAPEDGRYAMYKQKTWKRVAVLFAGPGMNFVIGLVLIYGIAIDLGSAEPEPATSVVGETPVSHRRGRQGQVRRLLRTRVPRRSPASRPATPSSKSVTPPWRTSTRWSPRSASLGPDPVRRAARRRSRHQSPSTSRDAASPRTDKRSASGDRRRPPRSSRLTQYNPLSAVPATFTFTGDLAVELGKSLAKIPTKIGALVHSIGGGERDPETPISVVGAADHRRRRLRARALDGVLVLPGPTELRARRDQPVPLLPFDGGHIAVAMFEKIRNMIRSARGMVAAAPVNYLKLMPATYVILVVVVGYMAAYRDRRLRQPDQSRSNRRHHVHVRRPGHAGTARTPLAPRRKTRQLMVGDVGVGSDHPIAVQSMCTTKTHDINTTLQQIAELTASGCDIVRVACPRQEDADALAEIARHSQIPVIADIHFQPKYIFAAIDAGCAAVRVNPGNIKEFDGRVKEVAKAASDAGIPIRIGVNAGSLDKRFMAKYGKATPEALVESALWEASLFEEHGFGDIKISVKHNDPVVMVAAYEQLAAQCDYPLHLGVTEAGPAFQGTIKSAVAFGALLARRASATPSGCRCPRRRSRRSRSATRSSSR